VSRGERPGRRVADPGWANPQITVALALEVARFEARFVPLLQRQ